MDWAASPFKPAGCMCGNSEERLVMPMPERPASVLILENVRKSFREPDGRELPVLLVAELVPAAQGGSP